MAWTLAFAFFEFRLNFSRRAVMGW